MASRPSRPLPDPPLQLITGVWRDAADLEARVAAALRGGIGWIQLRAKQRPASELYAAASRLAAMANDAGALLVVNDRVDIAIAAGAGGVHLPENGMKADDARALLGDAAWIAKSVHSVAAVEEAAGGRLDALQFGPVYETPSKRGFGAPQGTTTLASAASAGRRCGAPAIVAVGGIGGSRIGECIDAGAGAVSIIGAIWDAPDVEAAARDAIASLRRRGAG